MNLFRKILRVAAIAALAAIAGCAALEDTWQRVSGASTERTFQMPVARVKPAFVSTLAQMGMPISAMQIRGGNEVVKAGKADRSVEIEFERLNANATRVRVTGSGDAPEQILREAEKRLRGG